MTTLKEHQAAMVDLLANGSAIPASASRLAHAMHDVLEILLADKSSLQNQLLIAQISEQAQNKVYGALSDAVKASFMDATTPGLNEKALSKHVTATKTDSHATRPAPAEIRVKELENTIKQLKANLSQVRKERDEFATELAEQKSIAETHASWIRKLEGTTEQAGARKPDTQVCEHEWVQHGGQFFVSCAKCGAISCSSTWTA